MKKFLYAIVSVIFMFSLFSFVGCDNNKKIKLYFDGGGGSGNYNSTINMTPSAANPYPYNTLEKLAKEWSKSNNTYEIVVNKSSLNGRRDSITSMLSAGTAPDLLYQVGGVINDDIGKNWYAKLTEYLDMPNPYVEGNQKWRELYNTKELLPASDDNHYSICLDKIPVGLMYNMDILNAAGITTIPETYSEFLACLATLTKAKADGIITAETYVHQGFWHEIYLHTSVYGAKIAEWDVDKNQMISSYELIKAYKEDKWKLDSEEFHEYLKLCLDKANHYPNNYLAYDTAVNFSRGKLAVTDGLGNNMRIAQKVLGDKLVVSGYPRLDEAASSLGGYTGIRGSAGLSSSYWVTNSAVNKGDDAVKACVDFLMFLTAPKNNAKMVNDLGFALPLNVSDTTIDVFSNLVKQYEVDIAKEGTLMWGSVSLTSSFGNEFSDTYERDMGNFYKKNGEDKKTAAQVIELLEGELPGAIDAMVSKFKWTF